MRIVYAMQPNDAGLTEAGHVAVAEVGLQACPPGHSFGPAVRDTHVLHFILSGRGVFHCDGTEHALGSGKGFLIHPGTLVHYEADRNEPWQYAWICFSGDEAESSILSAGLSRTSPIFRFDETRTGEALLLEMMDSGRWLTGRNMLMKAWLWRLLAEILETQDACCAAGTLRSKAAYANETRRFISAYFDRPLSLSDMGRNVGLHPRHLSVVFKQAFGLSPCTLLLRVRMERACALLRLETLSVGDVARSVGYRDPLHFSRAFHTLFGISPRAWREDRRQKESAMKANSDVNP